MRAAILILTLTVAAASAEPLHSRGLLDFLSGATKGTKLGAAFKVIDAFGKVSQFLDDLKHIAPEVHQALNSSVSDLQSSMGQALSSLSNAIESAPTKALHSRGLLDFLSGATKGTKLGAAFKVIDAFGKVSQFLDDLKHIAPEVHQALNSSVSDLQSSMGQALSSLSNAIESAPTKALHSRGLLDFLSGATKGTKLGAAFKVIDAFGKVSQFLDDLKHIAPEVHQALNSSVSDIQSSMGQALSSLSNAIESAPTKALHSRGLLDFLSGATKGTKLGAAFKVIDAFGKVSQFLDDLKHIAPEVHQALNSSVSDIQSSMGQALSSLSNAIESAPTKALHSRGLLDFLSGATKGTKLGAAFKVIDAFGKVSQFLDDLKHIAPEVHQALNSSVSDIQSSMGQALSSLSNAIESAPTKALHSRGLLDFLSGATKGTKLGAAFKVIDAFGKVSQFLDDLKHIAPEVHQALNSSVSDIQSSMGQALSSLSNAIESAPTKALHSRGLLDFLSGATKGTKLGAAFKVIDAFGKVSQFLDDLKHIAPEVHQALNSSVSDIQSSMGQALSSLSNAIESAPTKALHSRGLLDFLSGATKGTKLGAAFKVIDAFGKVSQFLDDLKHIAPEVHQALNSSVSDIQSSMGQALSSLSNAIESAPTKALHSRGLLDFLSGATKGTKLGAAFKVIDAFGKVSQFLDDLKHIAPEVHQALNSSVSDIQSSMGQALSSLSNAIESAPTKALHSRGLLDFLSGATKGTKLGAAFKVIDAFGKVSQFLDDLKHIAPEVHQALNSSVSDIQSSMGQALSSLSNAIESAPTKALHSRGLLDFLSGATKGTKLGAAFKVIDAFGKVSQFLDDLKHIAPEVHQALNSSVSDIQSSMGQALSSLSNAIESAPSKAPSRRGLLDFLSGATKGTKLGAALDVIDAFGKVRQLIDDVKHIAPEAHQALQGSIADIKSSISDILGDLKKAA